MGKTILDHETTQQERLSIIYDPPKTGGVCIKVAIIPEWLMLHSQTPRIKAENLDFTYSHHYLVNFKFNVVTYIDLLPKQLSLFEYL